MKNCSVKIFDKKLIKTKFSKYTLGIDVGGTSTNLGIAGIKHSKPNLLFSLRFKSQELKSLIPAVNEMFSYARKNFDIKDDDIVSSCIGAAGVVVSSKQNFVDLTNVPWDVDIKKLLAQTSLTKAFIINDFQAIGYGINLLDPKNQNDMIEIRKRERPKVSLHATKAIIGAGTGFGKSILIYDKHFNTYVPIHSEGGHADFPAQNNFEVQLVNFIKELKNISSPISYEEVISGRGLESIYLFIRNSQEFKETRYTQKIDSSSDKAMLISQYKTKDETCAETFRLFTKFYARCAKNYVLDTMAVGGLYIAGGIASKNKEIFASRAFFTEFENSHRRSNILKNIPIYLIVNYDVSLYGACLAAIHKIPDYLD